MSVTMRLLKRSVLVLLLAISAPQAWAERGDERHPRREDVRQGAGPGRPDYRREAAPGFSRGDREPQRPQRLSPEERRQLRSDIRDAGREIYPRGR